MGEVYRATDTKLNRDVALKILPEQFASDSQRMGRFQREAEVLASLDHPNIGQIYGIEEAGVTKALVLQLIEGPTLAEKIAQGPIPVEETLKIALQIAEGLEAAHEKGVIHRDLKPANIKVTPEGQVKILDFGLAKALEGEVPDSSLSQSPTLTNAATQAGVILGTAAYMSPEQAKGKAVDKRADIFAFGAVLYECLTGKRAFQGEDVSDTLASILAREPAWESLPEATPRNIRRLLLRCMQKDPHNRLHHVADVRIEIKTVLADPSEGFPPAGVSPQPRQTPWALVAGLAILMFVLGAGTVFWLVESVETNSQPTGQFTIDLEPDHSIPLRIVNTATGRQGDSFAVSPDGNYVVYIATKRGTGLTQLYLRSIDKFEAKPLPGTEEPSDPFFSPDSQWIGFLAENELKKVSLTGGPPVSLARMPGYAVWGGLSWGEDVIVFGTVGSGVWQVPVNGGEPQPMTTLDSEKDETRHGDPFLLPGGQGLLFTSVTSGFVSPDVNDLDMASTIWLLSLTTGERRELTKGSRPKYASSGHIVFQRGTSLFALLFNADRLQEVGAPIPLAEKVRIQLFTGLADFSISDTGSFVYLPAQEEFGNKLLWVNRMGEVELLAETQGFVEDTRLSPDNTRLAVTVDDNVWVYNIGRRILTPVTFGPEINSRAIWTPDGKQLTFTSNRNIAQIPADGSGEVEVLIESKIGATAHSWSPDGTVLAYSDGLLANRDIRLLPQKGEGEPKPLLVNPFDEHHPRFSPDGRWIAFISRRSGSSEIYITPSSGEGGIEQISSEGGTEPVWAPDGKELFYRDQDKMMAVSVQTEPIFRAETPRLLFEGFESNTTDSRASSYDVSSDGQRFVMIRSEEAQPDQIRVILNWFEELKERVPVP
jgi:serine/threonine protein kinase/WD40 repeat protein